MSRRRAVTSGSGVSRRKVLAAVASTWCHLGRNAEGLDEYIFTNCSDLGHEEEVHNFKVTGRGTGGRTQIRSRWFRTGERVPVMEMTGRGLPSPEGRSIEPHTEYAPEGKRSELYKLAELAQIEIEDCVRLESGLAQVEEDVKYCMNMVELFLHRQAQRLIRQGRSSEVQSKDKAEWTMTYANIVLMQSKVRQQMETRGLAAIKPPDQLCRALEYATKKRGTLHEPDDLQVELIRGRSEPNGERYERVWCRQDDNNHRDSVRELLRAVFAAHAAKIPYADYA